MPRDRSADRSHDDPADVRRPDADSVTGLHGLAGLPVFVAHGGSGSTWQSLVTAASLGLLLVVLLAVARQIRVTALDDLVVPVAAVMVLSSVAPLADYWLSDWVGWAFPVGAVMLAGLVIAAVTTLELTWNSPLTLGLAAVAVIGAVVLYAPITRAWHPPLDYLPPSTDAQVGVLVPEDGDEIEAGTVEVAVAVTGGTIGPGNAPLEELPADPEEAGGLTVSLDGERVVTDYLEDCTTEQPCESVTFPIEVEAGEHELYVEFTRGDGMPLAPQVTDRVTFEVS